MKKTLFAMAALLAVASASAITSAHVSAAHVSVAAHPVAAHVAAPTVHATEAPAVHVAEPTVVAKPAIVGGTPAKAKQTAGPIKAPLAVAHPVPVSHAVHHTQPPASAASR
jgi:hypothetical protein